MKLHNKILCGLVLGASVGIAVHVWAPPGAAWVETLQDDCAGPVGQLFLRMMLMTVVPLVFASIALGVAGIGETGRVGRVGGIALAYFVLSTALAALIGILLVNLLRPGEGIAAATREELLAAYRDQALGIQASGRGLSADWFVRIVPANPVKAAADMDFLALIFFGLVFGWALTRIPASRAEPMLRWLESLAEVVTRLIDLGMRLAPVGVFALVFVVTSRFGWSLLKPLGLYALIVLGGLLLHGAVVLSALVRLLGGMSPGRFWSAARASAVTAFSTSSSSATLPTNIRVARESLGVPAPIAGFVLPLGATMNMNGTALYEGVTVLFLAQVFGVSLSVPQQALVVAMAVVTAVGAAGVPGGSLPLLMGVLGMVGVPPEGIAVILGIDRLLDMSRTTLNVTGDLVAAVFVARLERGRAGAVAAQVRAVPQESEQT